MCLMHNEARQTETLEFGVEKGLLQGHVRRREVYALKSPELPARLWQSTFKGQVREGCCSVCDQLVHNSLNGKVTG